MTLQVYGAGEVSHREYGITIMVLALARLRARVCGGRLAHFSVQNDRAGTAEIAAYEKIANSLFKVRAITVRQILRFGSGYESSKLQKKLRRFPIELRRDVV